MHSNVFDVIYRNTLPSEETQHVIFNQNSGLPWIRLTVPTSIFAARPNNALA